MSNWVLTADEVVRGLRGPLRRKHIGSSGIWCLAMALRCISSLVFRVSILEDTWASLLVGTRVECNRMHLPLKYGRRYTTDSGI